MIELSESLVGSLLVIAGSFLVGCLAVGVQVIFHTKNFNEEYSKKIDKIRIIVNWELEKALRRLFVKKKYAYLEASENIKWTRVFPETFEDIRFRDDDTQTDVFPEISDIQKITEEEEFELTKLSDLEEIYKDVTKFKEWSCIGQDAKKCLFKIGKCIILLGLSTFIGISIFALYSEFIILPIIAYPILFITLKMYFDIKSYMKYINKIEKALKEIGQGTLKI